MQFEYGTEVSESQNEVRVRPNDSVSQRVAAYRLTSSPTARVLSAVDYWGTNVDHVGVRSMHRSFELVAEAAVDTYPTEEPENEVGREALNVVDFRMNHWEFLQPSPHVDWDQELGAAAVECTAGTATVGGAVDAVVDAVRSTLRYETGSTEIGIGLSDLRAGGAGVCQDFAHLAIGMLRSIEVPARYVSGYLFAEDETALRDDESPEVRVQTHAWIEAAVPGHGWIARDPTNGGLVGERHVVIGRARDYADVPPVRGVFKGDATVEVDAQVVIAKLGPASPSPHLDPGVDRPFVAGAVPTAQQWQAQQ